MLLNVDPSYFYFTIPQTEWYGHDVCGVSVQAQSYDYNTVTHGRNITLGTQVPPAAELN